MRLYFVRLYFGGAVIFRFVRVGLGGVKVEYVVLVVRFVIVKV